MMINVYAENLGWLFEDLKAHFRKLGAVVSEEPILGADAWICIRTSEFRKSPDLSRTIVQVHDIYDYDVDELARASLVLFTHPFQLHLWKQKGFVGRHRILPIGARSSVLFAEEPPTRPTLGFFCGETPRMEKQSHIFRQVVKSAKETLDFDVLMIGRNLGHVAGLGALEDRAASVDDYRRIDALFTASVSPAVPLSVYEACSIGLPVISTPRWFPCADWPSVRMATTVAELRALTVSALNDRLDLFEQRRNMARAPYRLESWLSEQIRHFDPVETSKPVVSAYSLPERIALSDKLWRHALVRGWSVPEEWGVWSDGPRAKLFIDIELQADQDVEITLSAGAFVHSDLSAQRIRASVNGEDPIEFRLDSRQPRIVSLLAPAASIGRYPGGIVIDFDFPDACSPWEVGESGDRRRLGLSLESVEISPLPFADGSFPIRQASQPLLAGS